MTGRKLTRSPSRFVVGGIIGTALLVAAFAILGWKGGLIASAALLYEAWTLVNPFPDDTLSEAVWEYAARPMVPYIFGIASGWALAAHVFPNQYAVFAWAFLMGHFFFQAHREKAAGRAAELVEKWALNFAADEHVAGILRNIAHAVRQLEAE